MTISDRAAGRRDPEFWAVSTGLVAALTVTAALAAWPLYENVALVILVVVASAAGGGIAFLATRRRWSVVTVAAVALAAYALLVVPLAMPTVFAAPDTLPRVLTDALLGPITAWKQLVTIAIPVGVFGATLIPALIVFLLGPMLALLAGWRSDRFAVLAAPVLLAMQAFGVLFGASSVSSPVIVGPLLVPAPREIGLALISLALVTVLLVWRESWNRRRALHRAQDASGVRGSTSHRPAALRRAAVAAGMLLIAALVAGVALAPALTPSGREVLRTSVEPELRLAEEVSPLSTYRLAFDAERYDATLFTVQVEGPAPDRLRMAALTAYDGAVFRVAELTEEVGSTDFRRVPTQLPGAPEGPRSRIEIEIDTLSGLWLPLPDSAVRVEFAGPRRTALSDGFYYSDSLDTGIQLAPGGVAVGDRIVVEAVEPSAVRVADLAPVPADQRTTTTAVPDTLVEWVDEQAVGVDGASLQELVDRLRSRGYLSHALVEPEGEASWLSALPGYEFAPSRSGHDLDRIREIFARLIERQSEVGTAAAENPELLVSAVGDDEQFATAATLIARHLGFDARVALGVRLTADPALAAPAPCEAGVCRGGNLTAWAEIRTPEGRWIPLDATPQFADPLAPAITTVRDPELPTDVPTQVLETRQSPEAAPADGEGSSDEQAEAGIDLSWLWAILRGVGSVLLVLGLLLSPFLTVIGAKVARRRRRRLAADPETRIAGGWLEWVDTARDHGQTLPSNATRLESARAVVADRRVPEDDAAGSDVLVLAELADKAIFSAEPPTAEQSEAFWQIVDEERRRLRAEQSFWQRLRAALSLASFTHAAELRVRRSPQRRLSLSRLLPRWASTTTRYPKGVTRTRRTGRSQRS